MDNCFRFGDSIDQSNLNVATTLHNMGIVNLLKNKFEESIELFERAMNIRKSIDDEEVNNECECNVRIMFLVQFNDISIVASF